MDNKEFERFDTEERKVVAVLYIQSLLRNWEDPRKQAKILKSGNDSERFVSQYRPVATNQSEQIFVSNQSGRVFVSPAFIYNIEDSLTMTLWALYSTI